jgi:thiamine transport system ATP-binding protein
MGGPAAQPLLRLEDVGVAYDGRPAVAGVDLALPRGEVLAVLGPSGCGKSTLLRAVAGLEPLASGRVVLDGRDLAGVPTHRRGTALMFQDGQLFGHLTVAQNVGYPLRLRRPGRSRPGRGEVAARVADLLALVGLEEYAERLPATLSGGERQRVALARALAVDPALLLLDEPLSALDAGLRERLAGDLRRILRASGTTAVMVTHDHEEAFAVADRLAVLRDGHLVQQGPIADVWAAPADAATALFLGYARVLGGAAADAVLRAAGAEPLAPGGEVALRRSALRVVPLEGALLTGTVTAARATPEVVRLEVDVDGVGVVDAVAPTTPGAAPAVAERTGLAVDVSRLARLAPQRGRSAP